jgi:NTP pyrophosphatase (non-canonical NTP hydrolase)
MDLMTTIRSESENHPYTGTKETFKELARILERNQLLTILMEECAEVSVEASKVIRFANTDADCRQPPLERELGDLMCMIELLEEYRLIDMAQVAVAAKNKREKLKKWSDLNV